MSDRDKSRPHSKQVAAAAIDLSGAPQVLYKAFLKSPMAMSVTSARDHHYIEVNETYERLTGYTREQLIGTTPFDWNLWVTPGRRIDIIEQLRNTGGLRDIEIKYRPKDGSVRTGLVSAELIDISGEPCVLGVIADITDLLAAQESVAREKAFTEALFGAVPGLIFVIDADGNDVRWVSRRHDAETGASLYAEALETFAKHNRERVVRELRKSFQKQHVEFECALQTATEQEVPFFFTGEAMQIGKQRYAVGVGMDISARKRAEKDLLRLSEQLITAQEAERSYLARELHDDTSQKLALLAIQLEALALAQPKGKSALKNSLLEMHTRVTEIASDIHAMSRRLHPSVLDRLGAVAAIRSMCDQVASQRGVAVRFDAEEIDASVSKDVALCLYRIAEEAITNSVKHGGATKINIRIRQIGDEVLLSVGDNGSGFDIRAALDGLGLLSMKERLRLVSGSLLVTSEVGKGTSVEAYVPVIPDLK